MSSLGREIQNNAVIQLLFPCWTFWIIS